MIVYVDIVFIVNFVISFTFLLLIKFLVNGKESMKVVFVCSLISVLLLFSFFLNYIFYTAFKMFGGIIVLSFTFIKTNLLEKILRTSFYYLMQFSLVGLTNVVHAQGIVLIICLVFLIVCFVFFKYKKLISSKNKFEKKVFIVIDNKKINLNAYLDSGNMSTYYGKAIIYLDYKYSYIKEYLKKSKCLVNTIGGSIEKDIYFIKEINIEKKKYKDVYISFGEINNFDCLLNVMMI